MIATSRAQLGSIVSLVADASLSVLSERVHRGSLANARTAMVERRDADQGLLAAVRELEARTVRTRPLGLTGTSH